MHECLPLLALKFEYAFVMYYLYWHVYFNQFNSIIIILMYISIFDRTMCRQTIKIPLAW